MGTYLQGVVEKKPEGFDEWQFVARVDPIVGAQSDFRDLIFGAGNFRFLEPITHEKGVPEDLSRDAKVNIGESVSPQNPDESLEDYVEDLQEYSSYNRVMYCYLEDLKEFNWDASISDKNLQRLRDSEDIGWNNFRIFKLVDKEDQEYTDWSDGRRWYEDGRFEEEQIRALIDGQKIEFNGRVVQLERRSRRHFVPESWFRLLHLMEFFTDHEEKVRFFFIHGN